MLEALHKVHDEGPKVGRKSMDGDTLRSLTLAITAALALVAAPGRAEAAPTAAAAAPAAAPAEKVGETSAKITVKGFEFGAKVEDLLDQDEWWTAAGKGKLPAGSKQSPNENWGQVVPVECTFEVVQGDTGLTVSATICAAPKGTLLSFQGRATALPNAKIVMRGEEKVLVINPTLVSKDGDHTYGVDSKIVLIEIPLTGKGTPWEKKGVAINFKHLAANTPEIHDTAAEPAAKAPATKNGK